MEVNVRTIMPGEQSTQKLSPNLQGSRSLRVLVRRVHFRVLQDVSFVRHRSQRMTGNGFEKILPLSRIFFTCPGFFYVAFCFSRLFVLFWLRFRVVPSPRLVLFCTPVSEALVPPSTSKRRINGENARNQLLEFRSRSAISVNPRSAERNPRARHGKDVLKHGVWRSEHVLRCCVASAQ